MLKSQIGFDFYLALGIFVVLLTYVFFQLTSYPIYFKQATDRQIFNAEAFEISQLLVSTPGLPANWQLLIGTNESAIKRIGLVDENKNLSNYLSLDKIQALNQTCNANYSKVAKWLGTSYNFTIQIYYSDGTGYLANCQTKILQKKASMTRFAIANGTEVTLKVEVGL